MSKPDSETHPEPLTPEQQDMIRERIVAQDEKMGYEVERCKHLLPDSRFPGCLAVLLLVKFRIIENGREVEKRVIKIVIMDKLNRTHKDANTTIDANIFFDQRGEFDKIFAHIKTVAQMEEVMAKLPDLATIGAAREFIKSLAVSPIS